jgi:antitoxin ParD1/3/4
MNVSLTPELERRVEERLKSGLYTSASELVREALRLFFQYEAERSHQIGQLDQRIREGLEQLDRGEGVPAPEARRRSQARLAARVPGPKETGGDAAR